MHDDDDFAILAWLQGNEKLPQANLPSPGLAVLVRRLRNGDPLGSSVRNALAGALEPIGASRMKLVLKLQHRGRGRPRGGAHLAYETLKLAARIDADIQAREDAAIPGIGGTPKRDLETADIAKRAKRSRSTGYAARATAKRAKGIE
jgi:hypothetical protein